MSEYSVSLCLKDLADSGDRPIYVMAPGNAGDCLISVGFFHLAEKLGLKYEVRPSVGKGISGRTVIFSGGGGLGGGWSNTYRDSMLVQAELGERVIIMPQSIQGSEDFLGKLGKNVTLFVRERRSLEHVSKYAVGGCKIALDHDTALHIDVASFVSGRLDRPSLPIRPKEVARRILYGLTATTSLYRRGITAFRTDREAAPSTGLPRKIHRDLSLVAFFGSDTEDQCLYTASMFLRLIDRFEEVTTDRLHVAVGAALLGKQVTLYDNSYFKCRAVHEMSLTGFNVKMRTVA